jgi:SARP family transcriptional regulator, regulator of embCAB operon
MLGDKGTRIQLCGRLVAEVEGRRLEHALPSRQGRLLFGYLAANRARAVGRDALAEVLWPGPTPAAWDQTLRAVLSKLRRVLGEDLLQGRSQLRLVLPAGASIDVELAAERLHDAESAVALGRWKEAWLPARIAWSVSCRTFMEEFDGDWITAHRRELAELKVRSLEAIAKAGLELGAAELPATERAARSLIELAPYSESGYRLLMQALEQRSNASEALHVYEQLRCRLRDDLGVAPCTETRDVHRRLLGRA